jgi:hypothetical protein
MLFKFLFVYFLALSTVAFNFQHKHYDFTNIKGLLNIAENNSSSFLVNLIKFGDIWLTTNENNQKQIEKQEYTRVPGCNSVVYVRASVSSEKIVRIEGSADSRIANGMLAVLCLVCTLQISFLYLKL